ncbi:MAG: NfeD family protein [Verrucomicrobiota bacterium]
MDTIGLITLLTVVGVVLIGVDFFLPGFVLGSIGILLMLTAVGIGYSHGGLNWGAALFVLETALALGTVYVAIRYGSQSAAGKLMILSHDQTNQSAVANSPTELVGATGIAQTLLRPAGTAELNGKRLDVVAESGMIEPGSNLKVVAVEGARIVVRKV